MLENMPLQYLYNVFGGNFSEEVPVYKNSLHAFVPQTRIHRLKCSWRKQIQRSAQAIFTLCRVFCKDQHTME